MNRIEKIFIKERNAAQGKEITAIAEEYFGTSLKVAYVIEKNELGGYSDPVLYTKEGLVLIKNEKLRNLNKEEVGYEVSIPKKKMKDFLSQEPCCVLNRKGAMSDGVTLKNAPKLFTPEELESEATFDKYIIVLH